MTAISLRSRNPAPDHDRHPSLGSNRATALVALCRGHRRRAGRRQPGLRRARASPAAILGAGQHVTGWRRGCMPGTRPRMNRPGGRAGGAADHPQLACPDRNPYAGGVRRVPCWESWASSTTAGSRFRPNLLHRDLRLLRPSAEPVSRVVASGLSGAAAALAEFLDPRVRRPGARCEHDRALLGAGGRQALGPPGLVARLDHVGRAEQAEVLQRGRGQARRVALVADHHRPQVVARRPRAAGRRRRDRAATPGDFAR